jgi:hypothetical protein
LFIDRRKPSTSDNVLLRFLDSSQDLELSTKREKASEGQRRQKTMKNGRLAFKVAEEDIPMPEKDKCVIDDDLTASEGEFEPLPAGPSAPQLPTTTVKEEGHHHDDDTTEDEEEEDVKPFIRASASSSDKPSSGVDKVENALDPPSSSISPPQTRKPLNNAPAAIVWDDIRGTMGERRGRNGRILAPGQSDDEEGSATPIAFTAAVGSGMRMKAFIASSRGKDRVRKEDDQAAYVSRDNGCVSLRQKILLNFHSLKNRTKRKLWA